MAVATGQLGLLSRRQANGVGMSNAQLRSRVSSGSLLQVGVDTHQMPGRPDGCTGRPPRPDARHRRRGVGERSHCGGPSRIRRLPPPSAVRRHDCVGDVNVQRIGHRIHPPGRRAGTHRPRCGRWNCDTQAGACTLIHSLLDPSRSNSSSWPSTPVCETESSTNCSCIVGSLHCVRRGGLGIPRLVEAIEGTQAVRGGHSWLERGVPEPGLASGPDYRSRRRSRC